jgi:tetratricopeptide (TPR) repeat protein
MLYSALGRPQEAESSLRRALGVDPASVVTMQELFALLDGQGRGTELQPLLQTALLRNPRSAMHHNWMGLVLRRKGDLKGARLEFEKTLESAPDLVGAMANLGSLDLQEGRLDDATAILGKALDKEPRNVESRTNLIVAHGMRHDVEAARKLVKDAEGLGMRVPLFYNGLAYALHINGRSEEALDVLRESFRIDPRQADARRLQAEIEQGRPLSGLPYR